MKGKALNSWKPGRAARFPEVEVTRGPVRNDSGATTYLFNGRYLVKAIADGLLGDVAAETWRTTPIGLTDRLIDISGIFRVLDRGSFDFEVIHIPTVLERDSWRCHICNGEIDRSLTHGPDRASLDHVMPIAKGGSHTYDNVKASHWRCNHRKGVKPLRDG
jgi:HNH endonuclease